MWFIGTEIFMNDNELFSAFDAAMKRGDIDSFFGMLYCMNLDNEEQYYRFLIRLSRERNLKQGLESSKYSDKIREDIKKAYNEIGFFG
jgi:hypothetical protein